MCSYTVEHLGSYFDHNYMCSDTESIDCALQGHRCDSPVVIIEGPIEDWTKNVMLNQAKTD